MTAILCAICPGRRPRQAESRSHICAPCHSQLRTQIEEIGYYAATLTATPARSGSARRAPGYTSRSPGNDDAIIALDYRSRPGASVHRLRDPRDEDDRPIRSVLGSLHGITQWIRGERGLTTPPEPPTNASEIAFLLRWLDWCAGHTVPDDEGNLHPWIDDLADDIRDLHRQVRGLSPLGGRARKVGRCPEQLDTDTENDPDAEPKICGHAVFAPLTGDTAWCTAGHRWTRDRWLWLGTLMETTTAEAS